MLALISFLCFYYTNQKILENVSYPKLIFLEEERERTSLFMQKHRRYAPDQVPWNILFLQPYISYSLETLETFSLDTKKSFQSRPY